MTTNYELYKKGDFSALTKTVTQTRGKNRVTISIDVAHIKGARVVAVKVTIHKWEGMKDAHAFLNFTNVKDGWKAFRELCAVLGVIV